jgi:kynurenine formamidase
MKRWKQRPEGSNWGEFGDDDQKGRINLITPEIRRRAATEIVEGVSFCLSLPLNYPGGSALTPTRRPPRLFSVKREAGLRNYNFPWRAMTCQHDHLDVSCDDAVTLFTQYSTQWDSLAHYGQFFDADGDGVPEMIYYNGYAAGKDVVAQADDDSEPSAKALGIENMAETCAQGRGVLVNLYEVHGRNRLAVGYDELMRIVEVQRVEIRTGDFLCLYTGFDQAILEMKGAPDVELLHRICAGLDGSDNKLLKWISDSGIAAIACDNSAVEILSPNRKRIGPRTVLPLHTHCLFKLGLHLGELWYLKELAEWLAAHRRTSFFLTAPPLRLPGAVGSPLTPVATV